MFGQLSEFLVPNNTHRIHINHSLVIFFSKSSVQQASGIESIESSPIELFKPTVNPKTLLSTFAENGQSTVNRDKKKYF